VASSTTIKVELKRPLVTAFMRSLPAVTVHDCVLLVGGEAAKACRRRRQPAVTIGYDAQPRSGDSSNGPFLSPLRGSHRHSVGNRRLTPTATC